MTAFHGDPSWGSALLRETNPYMQRGIIWVEHDTGRAKRGPGQWNDLPYWDPARLPVQDLQRWEAKCDGVTDDTKPLQRAVDSGEAIHIRGRVRITEPIRVSTHGTMVLGVSPWGFSTSKSAVVQATAGVPAFILDDVRGVAIRDMAVEHAAADTDADAIGITFDGLVGQCDFRNLLVRNAGVGIGLDQTAVTSALFSSSFSNIRVNNYGVSALDFRSVNGGGTGCTLDAIYTNAGGDTTHGGPEPTAAPVRISQNHDWSFRGLHIEGVTADYGMEINNCFGLSIGSIHFEGYTAGVTSGGCIRVSGGNANTIEIGVVDVFGSYFLGADGVTAYYVIVHDSGATSSMKVGRINVSPVTDVTGCSLYPVGGFGNGDIVVEQARMQVGIDRPNFTAADKPVVRSYNGIDNWRTGGLTTSTTTQLREIWRTTAQGAPTTGTWRVGDKVWFLDPAAAGNVGLVCTTAGTPGTWKTFGAIAA